MKVLQWFCLSVAAIAIATFYIASQRNAAEVLKLRAEIRELSSLSEELAERRSLADQSSEVERLQKDALELRKLREETQKLKTDSQTLRQKMQLLEMQRAQNQTAREQQVVLQQQRLQNEKAFLRQYAESLKPAPDPQKANMCINNLRQIDGAVQQWALENKKGPGDFPTWDNLVGEQGYIRNIPVCPAGGQYTLGGVGESPLCNVSGHHLPN